MRRLITALSLSLALLGAAAFAGQARAAVGPYFTVKALWGDTNLGAPDEQGTLHQGQFVIQVRNVGDGDVSAPLTITRPAAQRRQGNHRHHTGTTGRKKALNPTARTVPIWPKPTAAGSAPKHLSCTISTARAIAMGGLAPGVLTGPEAAGESSFAAAPTGYLPPIYVDVEVTPRSLGASPPTRRPSSAAARANRSATSPRCPSAKPLELRPRPAALRSRLLRHGLPVRLTAAPGRRAPVRVPRQLRPQREDRLLQLRRLHPSRRPGATLFRPARCATPW